MKWLVAIILGAVLLTAMKTSEARGIRNNNPGNIRWDKKTQWLGQIGVDDKGFVIFSQPQYGIRAIARTLTNYEKLHGLNTVRGIIGRWAPPKENITAAYIRSVSSKLGVSPDEPLNLQEIMPVLVSAIIHHENGKQPYTMTELETGISRA